MVDLLRDPIWQFVGAIIALLALPLAFQRKRKRLSYEIDVAPVASVHEGATDLVRVVYDGREIKDPRLVRLRVINDGTEPISPSDYAAPLTLRFDTPIAPIAPTVARQHPHNLNATVAIFEAGLEVKPVLINPGDWFEIRFLLDGELPAIRLLVRIVGAPNPQPIAGVTMPARPFVASVATGAVLLFLLRSFAPQISTLAAAFLSLGVSVQIGTRLTRQADARRYPWRRGRVV
jgi:hypothetical protein